MPRSADQKIRLLVLYDILHKETDAEHQLSTNELIEKLARYGIQATRQTVYDDIEMLNAFGYEIITVHGRNNRYFVGDRTFELPEVQILLHAVGVAFAGTNRYCANDAAVERHCNGDVPCLVIGRLLFFGN